MLGLFALYLVAGAFREVLVVTYYKQIAKHNRYSVSGLAGGIEAYDLIVLATIIRNDWNISLMVAYTIGVMVGTFVGMGRKRV